MHFVVFRLFWSALKEQSAAEQNVQAEWMRWADTDLLWVCVVIMVMS